ncbi:MAG: flagellar assembly protein FliW [Firmicutes bacterium]|nr:flagellar assembly protein FliW [Bacillota bacterium]
MISLKGEKQKQTKKKGEAGQQSQPVYFRQGLPGFGSDKDYILHALEDNPFFYYLQSCKEQEMGLFLLDPFSFFPDYSVDLPDEILTELELVSKEDVLVLTTVTFAGEKKMTTNLAAPIIFNTKKNLAQQLVIAEKTDDIRTPVNLED